MALTQDVDIAETKFTGQTLVANLNFNNGTVRLSYVASPANQTLASDSADIGSAAATTLLTWYDQSTGLLTAAGETQAKTKAYNGNTLDTYFR